MTFWYLLPLVMTISHLQSCEIKIDKVINTRHFSDLVLFNKTNEDLSVDTVSITCTNITSLTDTHNHTHHHEELKKFLTIKESKIFIIPPSAFQNLFLGKLYLSGDHIKVLSEGAFNNLSQLEELYLDNNEIEELLNRVFTDLHKLKILDLGSNRISKIDKKAFSGLEDLKKLYLKDNRLLRFEKDLLMDQKFLLLLDLSGNPLEYLSLGTSELQQLSVMETNLISLDLSNIELHTLEMSHGRLSEMNCLDLRQVTRTLDLSYNQLSSVVPLSCSRQTSDGFYKLRVLDLSNNNISKIERTGLGDLGLLHHLNLSHNHIEEFLFGTFDTLSHLEVLDISYNKLISLQEYRFHSLSSLTYINFNGNRISVIDPEELNNLKNLRWLSMDKNLFSCQNLVRIDRSLKSMHFLVVRGNSFESDNVHGIFCVNNKDFDANTPSRNETAINDLIENSNVDNILFNMKDNRNMLIVSCVVQFSTILLIIFVLILCFYFKKVMLSRGPSLIELCTQCNIA